MKMETKIITREEAKACHYTVFINGDDNYRLKLNMCKDLKTAKEAADWNRNVGCGSGVKGDWIEVMDTHSGKILYRTEKW